MSKTLPVARGRPRATGGPSEEKLIRRLAGVFRSLADEHRLQILALLSARGEMSVTAIGEELGQSQPAVSHHLTQLRTVGLIDFRRDGKFNYYRLDEVGLATLLDGFFPGTGAGRLALGGIEIGVKKR